MAFYDFETVAEREDNSEDAQHRVNAVGLSFELREGSFSDVYFYDDALDLQNDGNVDTNCYSFQYWPSDLANSCWNSAPPKSLFDAKFITSSDLEAQPTDQDTTNQEEEEEAQETVPVGGFFDAEAIDVDEAYDYDAEDPILMEEILNHVDDGFKIAGKNTAMGKFVDFILDPKFYNYVFLAHNASRFDAILLLRELHSRRLKLEPVFDGNNLLQLCVPLLRIRFIDSIRYIKLPLAKFTLRFPDLEKEEQVEKGVFPYHMNNPDYYDYGISFGGQFPEEALFLDEFKTEQGEKNYLEFKESWPKNKVYVFKNELEKYLKMDIRVLRGGIVRLCKELFDFQSELYEDTPMNEREYRHPLSKPHFTRSSFSHGLWQKFEMEPETFYLLSNQRGARNTSTKEKRWLDYLISKGKTIKTEWNQPEGQKRFCKSYYPDGIEELPNGSAIVYEFFGCQVIKQ